jgi:SAM-dependent methyltransferase
MLGFGVDAPATVEGPYILGMLLRVATDLSELLVCAEQAEQESILGASHGAPEPLEVWRCEHPVLLTDTARITALEPGLRDTVLALYESYPRTVSYDGTSVSWSPTEFPQVWTANIDTLFFARTLRRHLDGVRSFAEIGCGSGFLTKYALMRAPSIEHAVASDISLAAIRCTFATLADISRQATVSLVCPQADDPGFSLAGPFDLVICNPPYIPRPAERDDNPYEGLGLIAKFAQRGQGLLAHHGVLLLNISNLAGNRPLDWFDDQGWHLDVLDRMRVPLKVNAVTSGVTPEARAWYEYLSGRGLVLTEGERGYRLWHELRMYACRRRH